MKFSVLMPVYFKERADNFQIALDSVLNQTLMPNEVLIIADGPLTAELNKVIKKFEKKYPKVVNIHRFKENRGLGTTLNEGINICKYEIIARMDSDDISHKNRFAKQIEYFKKDSNLTLLGTQIQEFDDDTKEFISKRIVPLTQEDIYHFAKKRNPFNHMSVMFKKSAVLAAGNYQDFRFKEDYYLWARMISKKMKVANLAEILVDVRTNQNLYKRRKGLLNIKNDFKFQKELLSLKITNSFYFLYNLLIRTVANILPSNLLRKMYIRIIRNEKSKIASILKNI